MMKLFKLADQFQSKLAGFFSETDEERAEREAKKREELDAARTLNKQIWDKVSAWNDALTYEGTSGNGLDSDVYESIIEYNRKSAIKELRLNPFWTLDFGTILDLQSSVNMETGEIIVKNLRVVYEGKEIPEAMKSRIESATGKRLEYYAPHKVWVYDAQLNGNMQEGNPRMVEIAKTIMKSDLKNL